MHSHDRSETDESLACVQSAVLELTVKEALFRNNTTKVVSQKHSQNKKSPQVHFVLVHQIRVARAGDRVICADTGLVSTSEHFGIMDAW